MMDNIIAPQLHRAGSVGYVSKSGEHVDRHPVAHHQWHIRKYRHGDDRYPGAALIDHLQRYKNDTECKTLLLSAVSRNTVSSMQ